MQEIQRFNRVLKLFVLLGDIILLNLLLWGFEVVFGARFYSGNSTSLLQGMVLLSLCYLICNIQSGVILHNPVVRSEQIMIRVLRNMVSFCFVFRSLFYQSFFEVFSFESIWLFLCSLAIDNHCLRLIFRYFLELY